MNQDLKHCLITGGAGFIGSHLAQYLLNEGNHVQIIDDLSTGSMKNILPFKDNPGFSYTIDSCQNKNLMAELVDRCDEIYHLAAAVGVKLIVEDPARTIHLNYTLTEIVLEMAAKKGKPVLFTSTSEVYGKSEEVPYQEDGDLLLGSSIRWRWAYACSKLLDEFMLLAAYKTRSVPVVIVRLFNTVGPCQTGRYGMVIPNFVSRALQHLPVQVYGDGKQTRCFCHVKNVVPVLPELIRNPLAYGQIFNVGSDREISILELARLVKKQLNSRSEIQFVPYEEAYNKGFEDMKRRIPCLNKIKSILNFNPDLLLEKIISDVAEDILSSKNS
ncbi:MAG: GDP-mannose 4,6-dehydratase [Candidatus Aureabacteria bacterium]|nr:GDP-mannose 4,6-dehydratase [Candidatus Auribacterota bacterium]